jgi:hypothetical protein
MLLERRHFLLAGVLFGSALLVTRPLHAHRVHEGLSVVRYNPRTLRLEVTHRLQDHDVAPALAKAYGRRVEPLSREGQLLLRDYTVENFALTRLDNTPIPLEFVGVEAENDFIYVYFEAKMPPSLTGLVIKNSILNDWLPDQRNQVNIHIGASTHSLLFRAGDRAKRVMLAP